jgi:hypothetical protein
MNKVRPKNGVFNYSTYLLASKQYQKHSYSGIAQLFRSHHQNSLGRDQSTLARVTKSNSAASTRPGIFHTKLISSNPPPRYHKIQFLITPSPSSFSYVKQFEVGVNCFATKKFQPFVPFLTTHLNNLLRQLRSSPLVEE